ncbi:hypothetical protein [uncultured Microscilla sp.]|uniref:hypothetical protein n=1 Tax=uncultured Microscilla sp. TaxID=432653 RepID=UPI0026348129|nr:hypothetical protein [uncultured Microscilla sp.]
MTRQNPKKELKQFIQDEEFIELMDKAFADLRADYELALDSNKEKINELKQVHVDIKNSLSNLTSYSCKSSGIVSGLRGTGKTHLFLLARDKINNDIVEKKALCIYLNLKRLQIPETFTQEIFNRAFGIFLYKELGKQLVNLLKSYENKNFFDKIKSIFNFDQKKQTSNIKSIIAKIELFQQIVKYGTQQLYSYKEGDTELEQSQKELFEIYTKLSGKLGIKTTELNLENNIKQQKEYNNKYKSTSKYLSYLDIQDIRDNLISIIEILKLNNITVYVDEWEKIYTIEKAQEYLSSFIDKLNDTPLYFWIGYVPYRGDLHHLDVGADLQHRIDLDKNLIYENSKRDKELCLYYFKSFINQRLNHYLKDYNIDYSVMFNGDKKLEHLVLACMGNSRDFGTMLLDCWSAFRNYRVIGIYQGRPFKYISDKMISDSIKSDGEKKLLNIKGQNNTMTVWRDIQSFATQKKSSHIAIEETNENMGLLSKGEFSELLYHRLFHFRKGGVAAKDDRNTQHKLSIYALNYACTYDQHSKDKKFTYITTSSSIDDKVRRYIYQPNNIINTIKTKEGEIHSCKNCKEKINIIKMKAAWEKNSCPFCGENIYKAE